MKIINSGLNFLLIVLLVSMLTGCGGTDSSENAALDSVIKQSAVCLTESVDSPGVNSVGGDWTITGLNRADSDVPSDYYEGYYRRVCNIVKKQKGELSEDKYTDYARVGIALTSMGKDPRDVSGYDLLKPLENVKAVTAQGLNAAIFALITKNCGNYKLNAEQEYLEYILGAELVNGGFPLDGGSDAFDADITAMALQALAFYKDDKKVKEVISRGVDALASSQEADGGYDSAERNAQVIIALTALGISPEKDERFTVNGRNPVEVLLEFQTDGGFSHEIGGEMNLLSTEQAMCAMASVKLFYEGKTLYKIKD